MQHDAVVIALVKDFIEKAEARGMELSFAEITEEFSPHRLALRVDAVVPLSVTDTKT